MRVSSTHLVGRRRARTKCGLTSGAAVFSSASAVADQMSIHEPFRKLLFQTHPCEEQHIPDAQVCPLVPQVASDPLQEPLEVDAGAATDVDVLATYAAADVDVLATYATTVTEDDAAE